MYTRVTPGPWGEPGRGGPEGGGPADRAGSIARGGAETGHRHPGAAALGISLERAHPHAHARVLWFCFSAASFWAMIWFITGEARSIINICADGR